MLLISQMIVSIVVSLVALTGESRNNQRYETIFIDSAFDGVLAHVEPGELFI